MKYAFVEAQRRYFGVKNLCRAMGVSRSGYYTWRCRPASRQDLEDESLTGQIRVQHGQTRNAYGAVKMWRHLNEMGLRCGKHRVARLRQRHGIETRRQRRYRAKNAARHGTPPAPKLVHAPFHADSPNEIWVGDITFVPTRQGWLCMAVLLDLYSRHVVGWAMRAKSNTDLVLDALHMAVQRRQPRPGLIHHTDQGVQYNNRRYRQTLHRYGLIASMSRKANCYDNAVAESFFSTLKNELVHDQDFTTRDQAKSAIFEYIEVFYNRTRLHQSLDYMSPSDYERMQSVA